MSDPWTLQATSTTPLTSNSGTSTSKPASTDKTENKGPYTPGAHKLLCKFLEERNVLDRFSCCLFD
jgi:hypothetical protein